jgi:integrase
VPVGNWLTAEQGRRLLLMADGTSLRGKRDYATLAILLGCGLRRAELTALRVEDLQQRTRLCADLGEQVKVQASQGEIEIAKSVVSVAELVHGAYRAKTPVQQQGRLAFIERLSQEVPCPSGDARHVRCSRI